MRPGESLHREVVRLRAAGREDDLTRPHPEVIRDRLALVRWLYERLQHFHANVDRLTFRYHAFGHADREWIYLIRRGTVRAEVRRPTTDDERVAFQELVQRIYGGVDPSGSDVPTHDLDEFYLVASWFRRRPEEKKRARPALAELPVR
jgi:excinuclease ABC subunit C